MKKIIMFLIMALMTVTMLTGCLESLGGVRDIAEKGLDAKFRISQQGVCNDTSLGVIIREYEDNPQKFKEWVTYCFGDRFAFLFTAMPVQGEPLSIKDIPPKEEPAVVPLDKVQKSLEAMLRILADPTVPEPIVEEPTPLE